MKTITTVQEFWKLVDDIDIDSREDGKFTEDEMFDIGCAFKSLRNSEKREIGGWDKLVEILKPTDKDGNIMAKGDTFRQWVKDRCYRKGLMTPNPKVLSDKTVDEMSFEDFEAKTEELKASLYKQQVKTRDTLNAQRLLLRTDARVENIRDTIAESIAKLEPVVFKRDVCYDACAETEAVLLFSDLHIGMEIDNFYNKYNIEIAKQRVARLVDETINKCRQLGVSKLNVLNLGDLIQGDIHVSSRLLQEVDAVQQTIVAAEVTATMLTELAEAIPVVTYRSCLDNHSRILPNLKENLDEESFALLIDWYLKERLKGTPVAFTEDNLDHHIGKFTLMNGDIMVFAHGHEVDVNSSVQKYTAATRSYIKYVALGHWHSTKMKTFLNSKVFINGSLCGLDAYAEKRGLFGEPEQTLLVFSGNSVTNVTINFSDIR